MSKHNHLKKMEITNFRGLRDVSLDNLGLVNVLVGGNNVGKTTVLEALFLLTGNGNPENFILIQNHIRHLLIKNTEGFEYFSHNLDLKTGMELKLSLTDNSSLTISLDNKGKNNNISSSRPLVAQDSISLNQEARELFLKRQYKKNGKTKEDVRVIFNGDKGISVDNSFLSDNPFNNNASYISSKSLVGMDTYNYILQHNLEPRLIEYLKQFDSRIRNIKMIGEFLHVDIGLAKTLPITMMGDGLAHNIGILATMLMSDTKIILLDQLEDGLHHTAPEPLLKAILELAKKENKQVFITTHSIEMLQKFKAVLDEQKDMQDKFCLYALQRDKDDLVRSYRYSYSQFEAGIRNNWEVR